MVFGLRKAKVSVQLVYKIFNLNQGSRPFVKIKFKDFSRTFKDHIRYGIRTKLK